MQDMLTRPEVRPWGLGRLAPYDSTALVPAYASVAIDPDSQLAVYFDATGQRFDMGAHGTSTGKETTRNGSTNQDGKGDNDADQDSDTD